MKNGGDKRNIRFEYLSFKELRFSCTCQTDYQFYYLLSSCRYFKRTIM